MKKDLLETLLTPLARLFIRRAIKLGVVYEALKQAYINAAADELQRNGVRVTAAKIQTVTGVHRKDIKRLGHVDAFVSPVKDPVVRAVGFWTSHKSFTTRSGGPRVLGFTGPESEFGKLCSRTNSDINPYNLAFEMERLGLIKRSERGLKLLRQEVRHSDSARQLDTILCEEMRDLCSCLEINESAEKDARQHQLKTAFDNIPQRYNAQIRSWLRKEGGLFHAKIRRYLSKFDRDINTELDTDAGSIRVALSSFAACEEIEQNETDFGKAGPAGTRKHQHDIAQSGAKRM